MDADIIPNILYKVLMKLLKKKNQKDQKGITLSSPVALASPFFLFFLLSIKEKKNEKKMKMKKSGLVVAKFECTCTWKNVGRDKRICYYWTNWEQMHRSLAKDC